MLLTKEVLQKALVEPGYLEAGVFAQAAEAAERGGQDLAAYLVESGLISDEHLGQAVANRFDWRYINLAKLPFNGGLLQYIPETVAKKQRAMVFEAKGKQLKVATDNPENFDFWQLLSKTSAAEVSVYYATPLAIDEALRSYRRNFAETIKGVLASTNGGTEENIVNFVNSLLEYAYDSRCSDVHIEPAVKQVSVRLRIDGVLQEILTYPKKIHDQVVFRFKIMAKMRTDEHQAAQDGRFDYDFAGARFDVRVSVLPITNGENIVLRLLTESTRRLALEDLGFGGEDLAKVKRAAAKPYGMILSVGPTGSGKTTTLYALLQILNQPDVNIMTIEDPVEYQMERIQQTQVNAKKNLTFATGLRTLVRQDPDIIMVGEIRDAETAAIAVNIAMTGHLLLSTLHANDAATTFPRLVDMGIEPFLVASSVNVIIAQRLVRKICDHCRVSYLADKSDRELLAAEPMLAAALKRQAGKKELTKITLYKGQGCSNCGDTGYAGRTGVFEVMEVEDTLRSLINQKAPASVIYKAAIKQGMKTMLEDGVDKALAGQTTLAEVMRSTKF